MPRWSSSGPLEAFSPPFSPLCPWIRGLFPATEFALTSSPSLPNPGDPRATLAHAYLNSDGLNAAEMSSTARSRSTPPVWSPPSDPDRTVQIADAASRTRALRPWLACQRPCPLVLGPLGQCALPLCRWHPLASCQHSPARARPRPQI
jgi:hypothetical protein